MHFERLLVANVGRAGDREEDFTAGLGKLRRWIVLAGGEGSTKLLRALALASFGRHQMQLQPVKPGQRRGGPVQIEWVQVRHAPQERGLTMPVRHHAGWMMSAAGEWSPLPNAAMRFGDPRALTSAPELGMNHSGRLLLGYGTRVEAHAGTDSFAIQPDQRIKRCAGLFEQEARLTDPEAFLLAFRRKSLYRAGRARALLARLNPGLSRWAGWDVVGSLDEEGLFARRWKAMPFSRRAPMIVALDVVRHAYDASTRLDTSDPLQQPGVILLDRPEIWCSAERQEHFFGLLEAWFPRMQFFVALSARARERFPARLARQILEIPRSAPAKARLASPRLPPETVLLVDVDGTLPNLALMKLSRHYKDRGQTVALVRGVKQLPNASTVLASCTFRLEPSARRVMLLRERYGERLQAGGSGVDLRLRLAQEIEALAPDYTLYPELDGRAIGFLTRGCPRRCPYCVVPIKEGPPRLASDLDPLLQGRSKLILLDDNLLAHPSALGLLEEMVRRGLEVNFNQTLDVRLLTAESAELLRRIRSSNAVFTRRVYYFSLNDNRQLERVRERYALLQATPRDNVEFVCMYGFNTTLAQDVERFRFLRSLPGAYVFAQRYRPVPGGPVPSLSRFFDERAESLLDELVSILFRQNMKSMETYYRWVALQYAAQCGRVHQRLVETLYRYNGRSRMGGFLLRLSELAAGSSRPALAAPAPATRLVAPWGI